MTTNMLLIPHIRVHNANALSSPYTIGFPAMTAWMGAVHALQRKLNQQGIAVSFDAVGVISHQFNLQTYKGVDDFEYSINGTANPSIFDEKYKEKYGRIYSSKFDAPLTRAAFIEEARCHLETSLVIQYSGIDKLEEAESLAKINHCLHSQLKIAGGDIVQFEAPQFFRDFRQLRSRLMPGYALIERRDLMIEAMESGQDALDALLDYIAIHHRCSMEDRNGETIVNWSSERKRTGGDDQRGWIVPIATGFQGISELGKAKNQRDPDTPHRFAEAVVTLGEFKMAYRFDHVEELLWHFHYEPSTNLYLCQQNRQDHKQRLLQDGF